MRTIEVEHDMPPDDLVRALAWTARAEGLDGVLEDMLHKSLSEAPSPEPEEYLQHIVAQEDADFRRLVVMVAVGVERWFDAKFGIEKAQRTPGPYLTQQQVDELVALIRAQFRIALRFGPRVEVALEERWRAMGIIGSDVRVAQHFDDAYLAGRLYDVLTNNSTYAQMRTAARNVHMTRPLELSVGTVRRTVGTGLMRFVDDFATDIEDDVNRINNERVQQVIGEYISGRLKSTPRNQTGLSPEEVAATEGDRPVDGWRALARELRNRMLSIDAERDWHRVAASETRWAYNMGRFAEMAERGVSYVRWQVQADACAHCKRLLLESDGHTPRRFPMEDVQRILRITNGTNVGRSATNVSQNGWLPTALIHPWCRCVPLQVFE